jgi:hypothetical protein
MRTFDSVSIGRAEPAAVEAIKRLAALDGRRVSADDHLIADVKGKAWAAVSVQTGEVVADPFLPTAHVADLVRLHAARLHEQRTR